MTKITTSRGGLTIGALSRRAGVNIETIRYYERIGIMERPPRTQGGHRDYALKHVERLQFIRHARELGFGTENIRTLATLPRRGTASCAEARAIAAAHLAEVRAQRAKLAKLEAVLAKTVRQCAAQCGGQVAPPCPVLDVLQG